MVWGRGPQPLVVWGPSKIRPAALALVLTPPDDALRLARNALDNYFLNIGQTLEFYILAWPLATHAFLVIENLVFPNGETATSDAYY